MSAHKYKPTRRDYKYFMSWYGPGEAYHLPEYAGTIFETMTFKQFRDGWADMIRGNLPEPVWVRVGNTKYEVCLGDYSDFGSFEREQLRDYFRKKIGLAPIGFLPQKNRVIW